MFATGLRQHCEGKRGGEQIKYHREIYPNFVVAKPFRGGFRGNIIAANWIRGYNSSVHKHLKRIPILLPWQCAVIYFVTCCTAKRQKILANPQAHQAILAAWHCLEPHWHVGRYVVMPDHVHFFIAPDDRDADLSKYMQAFRSQVTRDLRRLKYPYPIWQREFFDHLLRSGESYSEKWNYVFHNPVRHGLVKEPEDWPYAGEIHSLEF